MKVVAKHALNYGNEYISEWENPCYLEPILAVVIVQGAIISACFDWEVMVGRSDFEKAASLTLRQEYKIRRLGLEAQCGRKAL
ncbi:hypothetical protein DPMN_062269 [Dreissena polymorpha]|uniref:Uncharacterized protein n=1 Tax=Dreissena polymorpha TaxID=45954 RepID=A0A9D4HJ63_DREPO|nr:hypothetical protein DPMN_062269 [Dreissena polymorpha]